MTTRIALASTVLLSALLSALALVGCKDDKAESATPDSATGAPAAAAPAVAKPAQKYLPGKCEVVGVVDIRANLGEASIKQEIVPQLDKALNDYLKKDDGKDLAAVLEKTGVKPLEDLHAAAFCVNDLGAQGGEPTFTAAIGGKIKPNTVVPALLESKDKDKFTKGKVGAIDTVEREGVTIGQAPDGTLLVSSSKAAFEEAAKGESGAVAAAKLPEGQSMALAAEGPPLAKLMSGAGGQNPFKDTMPKLQHVMTYSDIQKGTGESRITMADEASAKALETQLKALLQQVAQRPMPGMAMDFDPKVIAESMSVDGNVVVVKSTGKGDMLSGAVKSLSKELEKALSK